MAPIFHRVACRSAQFRGKPLAHLRALLPLYMLLAECCILRAETFHWKHILRMEVLDQCAAKPELSLNIAKVKAEMTSHKVNPPRISCSLPVYYSLSSNESNEREQ